MEKVEGNAYGDLRHIKPEREGEAETTSYCAQLHCGLAPSHKSLSWLSVVKEYLPSFKWGFSE